MSEHISGGVYPSIYYDQEKNPVGVRIGQVVITKFDTLKGEESNGVVVEKKRFLKFFPYRQKVYPCEICAREFIDGDYCSVFPIYGWRDIVENLSRINELLVKIGGRPLYGDYWAENYKNCLTVAHIVSTGQASFPDFYSMGYNTYAKIRPVLILK